MSISVRRVRKTRYQSTSWEHDDVPFARSRTPCRTPEMPSVSGVLRFRGRGGVEKVSKLGRKAPLSRLAITAVSRRIKIVANTSNKTIERIRVALGVAFTLLGIWFSYRLLRRDLIEDTSFVMLIVTFIASGISICLLPLIEELSFSNFTLKLKKAQEAAEVTLEKLNKTLELTFTPLLSNAKQFPGGFGDSGPIDGRVINFLELVERIKEAGLSTVLAPQISDTARTIAGGQLYTMCYVLHGFNSSYGDSLPTPEKFRTDAIAHGQLKETAEAQRLTEDKVIERVFTCIDTYKKLYELATG